MAPGHWIPVATNACFLAAKPAGGRSGRRAASEKLDAQLWVEPSQSRQAEPVSRVGPQRWQRFGDRSQD